MRRFLVTGGTGFLGSALVRALLDRGHRVRVLDNDYRGRAERLPSAPGRLEVRTGDIRDPDIVREACRGVTTICHLAYINGTELFYSVPELVLEVGIQGTLNVIRGAIAEGVPELAVASSSEVYQTPPRVPTGEAVPLVVPDPLNPRYSYGGGKIACELLAINYGRKHFERVTVFRPHNVYGPDMGFEHVLPQLVLRLRGLRSHPDPIPFPIQGSGEETRAFVYIDDFTDGLLRVIERGEHLGIYHIGSGEETPIRVAAEEVARYFGRRIRLVPGPLKPGSTLRRCPDIGRLQALGYAPRVPFRDGLWRLARWYDENAHLEPAGPGAPRPGAPARGPSGDLPEGTS